MKRLLQLASIFVTLCPPLGFCCSCINYPNRHQSLKDGICSREVYTAVVVAATCNCRTEAALDDSFDCRTYAVDGDSYSAKTLTRLTCSNGSMWYYSETLKTCMQAENDVVPGVVLNPEAPQQIIEEDDCELSCPFNDLNSTDYLNDEAKHNPCFYTVNITEVFIGNLTVGDVMETPGPDVLTTCAFGLDRILKLNEGYVVGVGGPCSAIQEWEALSKYSERDLSTLRGLAAEKKDDNLKCGTITIRPVVTTLTVLVLLFFIIT